MKREKCQLLVVDIQEGFIPVMDEIERVISNSVILLEAANGLNVPITISEQYPKGLGGTVSEINSSAVDAKIFSKSHFNCMKDQVLAEQFAKLQRNQVVICGIEAHVCVLQTAIGLVESGFDVFVVADCVSSRRQESVTLAFDRLQNTGVNIVSTEMVIFEWLEVAGTNEFKQISKLIK